MKNYTQKVVPERLEKTCTGKTCDMCKALHYRGDMSGDGWNTDSTYDVLDTLVELKEGSCVSAEA